VPGTDPGHVLTGGDDGRLVQSAADGSSRELLALPGKWIDQVAAAPQTGLVAAGAGRTAHLLQGGEAIAQFDHQSGIGGLAFDPKGRRLAVSHYGGVSLWWTKAAAQTPRLLTWPGSHLAVTWSPDGRHVVTAMQENALHGWLLPDGVDMRMSGYATKVKSFAWSAKGRSLATAGSESVVCWPFHGKGGPMGKAPEEIGWGCTGLVTVVAAQPRGNLFAAGYEDGAVILVELGRRECAVVKHAGQGAVTALAWSADGTRLALGTEEGYLGSLAIPS
jgi:WD40 repeat protein